METEKNEETKDEQSEQVYEELTKDNEETMDEETVEEDKEEAEQQISEYKSKIESLDEKLAEFTTKNIADKKRNAMREFYYSDEQIERYLSHIDGETDDEITTSVLALTSEIPPPSDNYADPSAMNGAKAKPKAADKSEIARTLYQRIRHKVIGRSMF